MMTLDEVLDRLVQSQFLPPRNSWVGVRDEELHRLELCIAHRLPRDYRRCIALIGDTPGARLFAGSEFFWPHPLTFISNLDDYYEGTDTRPPTSSASTIVLLHQGYLACWLEPTFSDDPDPPVLVYPSNDGGNAPQVVANNFVEWLADFATIL